MKTVITLAGAGFLLAAGSALAQDVPDPRSADPMPAPVPMETQKAPPAAPSPMPPGQELAQRAFTDAEISAFATAALQMRDLRADSSLDDTGKQARAEAIVMEAGLDTETYSAIGEAAQADPAIAQRIQMAIEAIREEPGG